MEWFPYPTEKTFLHKLKMLACGLRRRKSRVQAGFGRAMGLPWVLPDDE